MFEAQKVSTLYCSHKCNSKHYKLKKKLDRKEQAELPFIEPIPFKPKVKAIDRAMIKDKEFLTVKDVSALFECTPKTVYSLIKAGKVKVANLGKRKTYIRRSDIDKLFEAPEKKQAPLILTINDCYTMEQITDNYGIARNTIYNYVGKHNIQRVKESGTTYYSKMDIDNLFQV